MVGVKKTYKSNKWMHASLNKHASIKDAIISLDKTAMRIVLVVGDENKLLGTVSDGDIRRGLLRDINLDDPIDLIANKSPLCVKDGVDRRIISRMMQDNNIQQIPVVDAKKRVIGIHLWGSISSQKKISNVMVVMAGGVGRRMMPHTRDCPKPMLKIEGKPILEHIINRARTEGITKFIFIVNYLSNIIENYFSDGKKWGVEIEYVKEEMPLGTAGGLSLIKSISKEPFFVINGDVLTDIRYSELLKFHFDHNADATMGIKIHEWQHPFGVIKTDGVKIIEIKEKPAITTKINAGIYVLNPSMLKWMKKNSHCNMTNLFENQKQKNLVAYPIHEIWNDIGTPEDYEKYD